MSARALDLALRLQPEWTLAKESETELGWRFRSP